MLCSRKTADSSPSVTLDMFPAKLRPRRLAHYHSATMLLVDVNVRWTAQGLGLVERERDLAAGLREDLEDLHARG